MMGTVVLLAVLSIAWATAGISAQDPCVDYTQFSDDGRRSPNNAFDANQVEPRFCDATITTGWYRFKVNGADADMPTTPPTIGSCNAIYPVWLDGDLPTVENVPVSLRACAVGHTSCDAEVPIKVTKCQTFNVYYLQRVETCPSAYCFGVKEKCPEGQTSEDGFQPGCTANFVDITPVNPVVKPILGISKIQPTRQEIRFQCDFKSQINKPTLFYDVIWYINDQEVHRTIKQTWDSLPISAELREHHWKDHHKMGMNVKCAIRARSSLHGTPSPEHSGAVFFAGLKILDTAINMEELEVKHVRFQATVPVPCLIFPGLGVLPCEMIVRFRQIGTHANGVCNSDNKPSSCGITIKANDWAAEQRLEVTAEYDDHYGDRLAQIYLKGTNHFIGDLESVWDGVEPQPVQVNIQDITATVAGSTCSVFNDPHFITFDKRRFDVHLPGEFVLFRHKALKLEVRGFFQKCSTVAHCVCGAAVRSGSQLFVWSKCKDNLLFQTTRVRVYGCNVKQMRVSVNDQKDTYEIQLPTGMKVVVNTYGRIDIVPSPADLNQTEGLCGNFNGNIDDEYIDPNGVQHSNTCERYLFGPTIPVFCMVPSYSKTWMINQQDSYYNGELLDTFGPPLIGHCHCATDEPSATTVNEIICENVPPVDCGNPGLDVTDDYCTQLGASLGDRRKRATSERRGSINDEDVIPVFPMTLPPVYVQPVWRNGWTEEKAEVHCLNSLKKAPAFEPCQKVPNVDTDALIESCVADILLSGGVSWTAITVENYKSDCISEVKRNTTLWEASPGERSILTQVIDNVCPAECSSKGICVSGNCVCSPPWIGPDCSVDSSKPPEVLGLPFAGLCNTEDRDCGQTVVYGENFVQSNQLKCRFEEQEITPRGTSPTGRTFITNAVFRHSSEVVCSLPPTEGRNGSSAYLISVSNYQGIYGRDQLYVAYNGTCMQCALNGSQDGLSATCLPNAGYCQTNGTCVKPGEIMASGEVCQTGSWTAWLNRDHPSGNGDYEEYQWFTQKPCGLYRPITVEVRLRGATVTLISQSGTRRQFSPGDGQVTQFVEAGSEFGFICVNVNQSFEQCNDYEVRFLCSNEVVPSG